MTALALTAAMVAGMAAPAYADVYYIGDGNITITKDESGTYVKHANSKDKTKGDLDNGEITIKGGKRSEDTPAPGGSSEGTTPAKSPAKSMSATPPSEDSENNDMVYLGDTKGGGEENKNQTSDTTGGEENENQTGGTSGGEKNETDFTKKTQSSDSPVLRSQLTYTGAPINVANANDDDETQNNSTQIVENAVKNFTSNVIRIINNLKASTLNVTLEDVNIDARDETNPANGKAALSVEGAGDTTITLKGDNTLTSGDGHAGLEHNEKSKDDNDDSVDTGKLTITTSTSTN